jgi:AraC-like DNA-binding protein
MLGTRREDYKILDEGLPFLLHADIPRSDVHYSKESNWHENLEIQLCNRGRGFVLLNGERYEFAAGDVIVANSDVLHYTGTDTDMSYSCLIVSTELCRRIGLATGEVFFEPHIQSPALTGAFLALRSAYEDTDAPLRTAILYKLLLEFLIALAEHRVTSSPTQAPSGLATVKRVITYTREHYQEKITLDALSRAVLYDKYALCREFKKYTGQTITDSINRYRCTKAAELLASGASVADAAMHCGFESLSYFSKIFLRHLGVSPSRYKKAEW